MLLSPFTIVQLSHMIVLVIRVPGGGACSLGLGVLPAMVMPIVDSAVGFSMTPATYPVPPVSILSFVDPVPLGVTSPASPAVGSPARSEALLRQVSSPASVTSPGLSPSSPVLRSAPDVSPPSGLAAMDQELPWSSSLPSGVSADSPLLPAPLTPCRMVQGMVVPGSRDGWKSPEDARFVSGGPL